MGRTAFELVFMLVILKIPIVYLCAVVWWAIRAEPDPPADPVAVAAALPVEPSPPRPSRRRRPGRAPIRPLRPHGASRPSRARTASAHGKVAP